MTLQWYSTSQVSAPFSFCTMLFWLSLSSTITAHWFQCVVVNMSREQTHCIGDWRKLSKVLFLRRTGWIQTFQFQGSALCIFSRMEQIEIKSKWSKMVAMHCLFTSTKDTVGPETYGIPISFPFRETRTSPTRIEPTFQTKETGYVFQFESESVEIVEM